jgi:hypothetical protein
MAIALPKTHLYRGAAWLLERHGIDALCDAGQVIDLLDHEVSQAWRTLRLAIITLEAHARSSSR